MNNLRAKLETECQNTERLSRELSASKANEATIAAQLEERDAAVAAATAENAKLVERINQLENSTVLNPRGTFRDRIKRLAKGTLSCFCLRERDLEQALPG
jgi:cell division septum initiation protein DivIVA